MHLIPLIFSTNTRNVNASRAGKDFSHRHANNSVESHLSPENESSAAFHKRYRKEPEKCFYEYKSRQFTFLVQGVAYFHKDILSEAFLGRRQQHAKQQLRKLRHMSKMSADFSQFTESPFGFCT